VLGPLVHVKLLGCTEGSSAQYLGRCWGVVVNTAGGNGQVLLGSIGEKTTGEQFHPRSIFKVWLEQKEKQWSSQVVMMEA